MIQPAMQSLTVDRVPARERSSAAGGRFSRAGILEGRAGRFALGPLASVTGAAATFAIAGSGTFAGGPWGFVAGSVKAARNSVTRA